MLNNQKNKSLRIEYFYSFRI